MRTKAAFKFFNDRAPVRLVRVCNCFLILAAIIVLFCPQAAQAGSAYDQQIGRFEQKLFMHSYGDQSDDSRIDRIEKTVFGQSMSGSPSARLARLKQALASGDGLPDPPATAPGTEQPIDSDRQAGQQDVSSTADDGLAPYLPEASGEPVRRQDGEIAGDRQGQLAGSGQDALAPAADSQPALTAGGAESNAGSPVGNATAMQPPSGVEAGEAQSNADSMPPTAPDVLPKAPGFIAVAPPYVVARADADGYPPTAPDRLGGTRQPYVPSQQPGGIPGGEPDGKFNERLGVLELQVFGMTFVEDDADERLNRLEAEVFSGAPRPSGASLADRLARLMADPTVRSRAQRADSALVH